MEMPKVSSSPYMNMDVINKASQNSSLSGADSGRMTVSGAVAKTAALSGVVAFCVLLPLFFDMSAGGSNTLAAICGIAAIAMVIAMIFNQKIAKYIAIPYAVCEGLFISGLVLSINAYYPGVALEALLATVALLAAVSISYKTGLIKVNEVFMSTFKIMTFGFIGLLVLNILTIFVFKDLGNQLFSLTGSGFIGIGVTLFLLVYGSFSLVLDIATAEQGELQGADKDFEWYCAVSLLITVVYIYIQMLRLFVQIAATMNRD